jgi:thiol-disulfide isomerase/thioredoxin
MRQLGIVLIVVVLTMCVPAPAAQTGPSEDPAFKERFEQGKLALKAGKYKDAIDALKKANKLQHNSCAECYLMLAAAYCESGDPSQCEQSCDKAVATAKDDDLRARAHNIKGHALFLEAARDNKKMRAAESEYRAAVQLEPKIAVFHLNLAKVLLRESNDDEAKQELGACLALHPDDQLARQAQLMLADPRRGREEFAPEFEVNTMQGQRVSLKQLAGRVVVLDFWATWCPPCRESVPELKDLAKKYPTEKLMLISVSADDDENAWREFVANKKMDWAQYRDADQRIRTAFGIHAFPTYLVIDGEGIIKQRITGLNPQETVVHRLKATLGQMPQLEGEVRK